MLSPAAQHHSHLSGFSTRKEDTAGGLGYVASLNGIGRVQTCEMLVDDVMAR